MLSFDFSISAFWPYETARLGPVTLLKTCILSVSGTFNTANTNPERIIPKGQQRKVSEREREREVSNCDCCYCYRSWQHAEVWDSLGVIKSTVAKMFSSRRFRSFLLLVVASFLRQSCSLSTPVKPVMQQTIANIPGTATLPIDLILSSGFCAFARQAGRVSGSRKRS